MTEVRLNMSMTERLKRYTIFPLMAMGVLAGSLSSNAQADPLDAKQLSAETVGEMLGGYKVIGTLTQADKDEVYKASQKKCDGLEIPAKFKKMITKDTILDHIYGDNYRVLYMDNGMFIMQQKLETGEFNVPVILLYEFKPEHIAEPLPPISDGKNSITKKPYFSVPKALGAKLSDKAYFKTLYKVMNSNFGTFMPMYEMDMKKIKKNEYTGKVADKPKAYFGEYPQLEKGMDETEIQIRRKLGFVLNGVVDIQKAGGKLSFGSGDCTGWTPHGLYIKDGIDNTSFLVFNGVRNETGTLSETRFYQLHAKRSFLNKFQRNYHALMQEHGVQPGTNIKQKGLTPDQQLLAAWGNVLDNYIKEIYKDEKIFTYDSEHIKSQKLKTLDKLIGKENYTPVDKSYYHYPDETRKVKWLTFMLTNHRQNLKG